MLLVVLAMVVLVPFLAMPSNTQMQDIANYALRVMTGLLAGVLVLRGRVAAKRAEVSHFFATGANLAVLMFLCISIAGILVAPSVILRHSLTDFLRIFTGVLLYFSLAYHIRRSEHLVKIQDALVLVSFVISLFGLIYVAQQQSVVSPKAFGDHQLYGAILMILFPTTVVSAVTERDLKRQIAAQVAAGVTGICLVLSQTRTSWVGTLVELLALVLFSMIAPKRKERAGADRRKFVIPILICLMGAGLFVTLGGAGTVVQTRMQTSREAMEYRYRMWNAATELIKQKPLIGHGLASYPYLQSRYSGYGRYGEDWIKGTPSLGEMAHSFWLQTTAEQGVFGTAAFAAILVTFLTAGVRRLRYLDAGIKRWLLLSSMASVIGFAVDALGNPAWQFAQIWMYLWLALGLGVACIRPKTQRFD
jgi:O-antigen ligase